MESLLHPPGERRDGWVAEADWSEAGKRGRSS